MWAPFVILLKRPERSWNPVKIFENCLKAVCNASETVRTSSAQNILQTSWNDSSTAWNMKTPWSHLGPPVTHLRSSWETPENASEACNASEISGKQDAGPLKLNIESIKVSHNILSSSIQITTYSTDHRFEGLRIPPSHATIKKVFFYIVSYLRMVLFSIILQ